MQYSVIFPLYKEHLKFIRERQIPTIYICNQKTHKETDSPCMITLQAIIKAFIDIFLRNFHFPVSRKITQRQFRKSCHPRFSLLYNCESNFAQLRRRSNSDQWSISRYEIEILYKIYRQLVTMNKAKPQQDKSAARKPTTVQEVRN